MPVPQEYTWRLAGRGVVFDHAAGRVVHGSLEHVHAADRVALIAHFDPGARLSPSVRALVAALDDEGWVPVVVSASPRAPDAYDLPGSAAVILRPNLGYDFGSWATALRMLPEARAGAEVILANDSMAGPFSSLRPLLARSAGADVWAVTSSLQVAPHLQSYFLRFAPGVLARPELTAFFAGIRHLTNKVAIVRRYELGLTRAVRRAGLRSTAGFPAGSLDVGRSNPTIVAWRELMEQGFPFFKRTLLRDPRVRVERSVLRAAVRDIFGAELDQFEDPA